MGHKAKPKSTRPIIVCTDKRGVFFGYVPESLSNESILADGAKVKLDRARMAVSWTRAEKGVMGLGAVGPGSGCRIGPAIGITLEGIHAVIDVTPEAAKRWEAEPWA